MCAWVHRMVTIRDVHNFRSQNMQTLISARGAVHGDHPSVHAYMAQCVLCVSVCECEVVSVCQNPHVFMGFHVCE